MSGEKSVPLEAVAPVAVEWKLGSPVFVVRGLIWTAEKLPVLFVHEPGPDNDLDHWKNLPELVHHAGHTVIAFDLPGHGLSEGTPDETNASTAIGTVYQYITERFGKAPAVVTEGVGIQLLPKTPFAALVVFSPRDDTGAQADYPKLVFCGATDPEARTAADRFLRASRGWTLVSSFGTSTQGAALLKTPHAPKIIAQVVSFLRDYS